MESQEGRISSPNISDTLILVTKGGPDRREIEGSCLKGVACGDNRVKRSWREDLVSRGSQLTMRISSMLDSSIRRQGTTSIPAFGDNAWIGGK